MLTGVWYDKHGVTSNSFKGSNIDHMYTKIEYIFPTLEGSDKVLYREQKYIEDKLGPLKVVQISKNYQHRHQEQMS